VTRRLAALLVIVALGLAAGCGGGDDENATQEWANDVCTGLNTWVSSIQSTVQGLTDKGLGIQRSDVQAAVDDAESATDELVSSLGDLTPPDDTAAQQTKSELDQLGGEIQQQLDNVQQAAASESNPLQLAQTVSAAVAASAAAAKSTFATIDSLDPGEDVKQAFQDAESCATLRESIENLG
jgi:hypothetical protein